MKIKLHRLKPKVVYTRSTDKYYTRSGNPLVIVLHSTESHNRPGTGDIKAVVDFLAGPVEASVHIVVDSGGHSGRLVEDRFDAWHVANENRNKLGIEQIGQAAQGLNAWKHNWRELREAARWIARWSLRYDIPIKHSTEHGVCKHADLGAAGGGHWDPGEYPLRRVLFLARLYKAALFRSKH